MGNRSRGHGVVRVLVACAVIGAVAWGIAEYFSQPAPRPPAATVSQVPLSGPVVVLPEVAVRAGESFTTPDGAYTVHVAQVAGSIVNLTVSASRGDVYRFDKAEAGRRLVVPAPDATYFLDLLRIRGNVVYLTMSRDS